MRRCRYIILDSHTDKSTHTHVSVKYAVHTYPSKFGRTKTQIRTIFLIYVDIFDQTQCGGFML